MLSHPSKAQSQGPTAYSPEDIDVDPIVSTVRRRAQNTVHIWACTHSIVSAQLRH